MTEFEAPDISTDLVPTNSATVDLRQATTDSWTDVLDQVADLAIKIAQTDFVPVDYRGKPGQVAAAILHGRELGMAPMTALAMTNPIKGKPTISAEGMRSLVLQAGHQIAVAESSGSRVILRGRRHGDEEWTSVTWTLDDARRAGLTGNNWQKYPRQMLAARATAELCRLIFADVIHGLRAAEELMDDVEVVTPAQEAEPEKKTTTVRRRTSKKAAAKKTTQPEPEPADQEEKPARKRAPLPQRDNRPPEPRPTTEGENDDTPPKSPRGESSPEETPTSPQPVPDQVDTEDSGEAAEVSTGRETGPQLTAGQRASVIMHFTRLEIDDRDERLWWTNHLLELEPETITSTNELRQPEAVRLLAKLERFKDRDQLDASLQQDELIPNDPQE